MRHRTGLVVVVSTRTAEGITTDTSGALAHQWLTEQGYDVAPVEVVSDAQFQEFWVEFSTQTEQLPDVVITSGGTGITQDDRTVEVVEASLDQQIPGIAHAFWEEGRKNTPTAILSRAVAGLIGKTFVMTLPGSRGGVRDGLKVLGDVLPHIDQLLHTEQAHQ